MRELIQIVAAFESLDAPCALASVVGVEGSAYRRPGARMLIASDGQSFGGVSGGCLERDVARRGRIAIDTQSPEVIVYETAEDGDEIAIAQPGPSLGCGGRIEILIEPISRDNPGILAALRTVRHEHKSALVATIIPSAQRLIIIDQKIPFQNLEDSSLIAPLESRLLDLARESEYVDFPTKAHGLPSMSLRLTLRDHEILLERIAPPRILYIYGDGQDVSPLVEFANSLGWSVTICAPRSTAELQSKFPKADSWVSEILPPPTDAAVVAMNHNLRRDQQALVAAIKGHAFYIGLLGPRRRSARMMESLGTIDPEIANRIFAPVGLDIGAQSPEQVALAVVAEISAVFANHPGNSLRQRGGPIHSTNAAE